MLKTKTKKTAWLGLFIVILIFGGFYLNKAYAENKTKSSYEQLIEHAKKGELYNIPSIHVQMSQQEIDDLLGRGKKELDRQDHYYMYYKTLTVLYDSHQMAFMLSYEEKQIKDKNLITTKEEVEKLLGKAKHQGFYGDSDDYYLSYTLGGCDVDIIFGDYYSPESKVTRIAVSYNYGLNY